MASSSKQQQTTTDFENLVRNGIDFLEKAMSQLEKEPKHSVVNFYTAVELFLKAPLVHEHWTLVVVDRDLDRQKYEEGDFLSVTFDDACARLSASLKRPLRGSARKAFDKVRRHRNRIMHFFHSGIDGRQRDEIKLEQAHAWFELNRFVRDTWREQFAPFDDEFRRMEHSLIANNHYAQAKCDHLGPKIEGLKKAGHVFETCPRCRTQACQVSSEADSLTWHHCLVCFHSERLLAVDCPECAEPDQHVVAYEGFTCTECEHRISAEDDLFNFLDQCTVRGTKDDVDSSTPANCDECQGYHTVCDYDDGYLCTNCLTFFDSVGQCQWCNDPMTGNTEDTYVTGCEHCDGYAGHHAND